MSSKPTASMMERRHPETRHIDTLATLDMLTLLHKDNRQIADAVGACLPEVARLVDNAAAALSRGGRLVIVGAGASGRAALQTVSEYTPEEKHSLVGLIAGGPAPRYRRWKRPLTITISVRLSCRLSVSAATICCWR